MSLKLSIFICVAAVLALVVPAAADNSTAPGNNTATIHGEVYSLDTFEPLDNAVVSINSTPAQSMVAKYGMYSFELEPGNYTITAKYFQNSTVTYSVDEAVNIKNKGNYVHDLLLLPVYSEDLMGSPSVNKSLKNSTLSAGDLAAGAAISNMNNSNGADISKDSSFFIPPVYYLLIVFILVLLSGAGYRFSRKDKMAGKITHAEKVPSAAGQIPKPEPETSTEPSIRPESRRLEEQAQPENTVKLQLQENEIPEPETEVEIQETSSDKPEEVTEIKTQDPMKKLPLPADLQEVMDIIRGQRGRITQKDLCSRLKCSDAKVSLMLADLERRELIEKFKKGRGNVVILKEEKR